MRWILVMSVVGLLVAGCPKEENKVDKDATEKKDDDDGKEAKKSDDDGDEGDDKEAKKDDDKDAKDAKDEKAADDKDDGDTKEAKAPPKDIELPPGRSKVPALAEWDGVGEVTVKGSSALNCETKMVREWLRISCRGKNDTGGTPVSVKVTKGGRPGEVFTLNGGVTSLVMPYMSGTHLEAVFTWTDKSHKLVVDWPRGAPKPPILAVFEGASSPLDAVGGNEAGKVFCECLRERLGGHSDDDCSHAEGNADCLRTYKGDCDRIIACNFGEPGVWPSCLSGYRNAGPGGWCMKECGRTQSCGAGEVCSDVWGEPKVCLEN